MTDHQNDGSQVTGIGDSGVVALNGGDVAELEPSGLQVLRVDHPDRGVLHVPWPVGELPTLEDVVATLGEPGDVKGPSATVWGDEHVQPLLGVVTPQGDGEPVKGPDPDTFAADEVVDAEVDPEQE